MRNEKIKKKKVGSVSILRELILNILKHTKKGWGEENINGGDGSPGVFWTWSEGAEEVILIGRKDGRWHVLVVWSLQAHLKKKLKNNNTGVILNPAKAVLKVTQISLRSDAAF